MKRDMAKGVGWKGWFYLASFFGVIANIKEA
jgi:hypothetical protein